MPSANKSNAVSPVTSFDVAEEFKKKIKLIINGGRSKIGIESTVINLVNKPTILRPGAISKNNNKNPNNLPIKFPLSLKNSSLWVINDSFQEIFKYTNVINTTRAEEFSTISKGIGKSPTFTTP